MTKPEAALEPSMDEILASIRKIIAEEPPARAPREAARNGLAAEIGRPGGGQSSPTRDRGEAPAPLLERIADAVRNGSERPAAQRANGASEDLSSLIYKDLGDMLEDAPAPALAPTNATAAPQAAQKRSSTEPQFGAMRPAAVKYPDTTANTAAWSAPAGVQPRLEEAAAAPRAPTPDPFGALVPSRTDTARNGAVAARLPPLSAPQPMNEAERPASRSPAVDPAAGATSAARWPDALWRPGERATEPPAATAPAATEPVVLAAMPVKPFVAVQPPAPETPVRSEPVVLAAMSPKPAQAPLAPSRPATTPASPVPPPAANMAAPRVAAAPLAPAVDGLTRPTQPTPAEGPGPAAATPDAEAPIAAADAAETNAAVASALGALAAGLAASGNKAAAATAPAAAVAAATMGMRADARQPAPEPSRPTRQPDLVAGLSAAAKRDHTAPDRAARTPNGTEQFETRPTSMPPAPPMAEATAAGTLDSAAPQAVSEAFIALSSADAQDATLPALRVHGGDDLEAESALDDTVAELLRPLLRQWLADNMPRIVEKALRIELADSVKAAKSADQGERR